MKSQYLNTALLLITALVISSCGSGPAAPLSLYEPEIVNDSDSFSFQATAIENVSGMFTYTWSNSGTQATINHSTVITDGTASVTIYDNDGTQVYSNGLASSLNEASQAGVGGNWQIVVTLVNCYGTINFSSEAL